MMTFPQTASIPAEHPCPNHDNVQRRVYPFPQSIHVATMIFDITMSPWLLIFSSLSSSCSSFLCCFVAVVCCCLRVFCLRYVGRIPHFGNSAFPGLMQRKSQIESFHAQKPTRKRIFTISYMGTNALKNTCAQKTPFFQSHFWLLKEPFFPRPRVQNPRKSQFLHA